MVYDGIHMYMYIKYTYVTTTALNIFIISHKNFTVNIFNFPLSKFWLRQPKLLDAM